MTVNCSRRAFLSHSAGTALALATASQVGAQPKAGDKETTAQPKKAVLYDMLPGSLSREDRFKLARDCGFDGVEAPPLTDLAECEQMRVAAERPERASIP